MDARGPNEPPTWALGIVVASIGFVSLAIYLARFDWLRSLMPFANSDYFYIGLIFLPMAVLVVVMIAAKLLEVKRAARWPQAMGKIVKSGTQAHHHQFAGEAATVTTLPDVEYEFTANGQRWHGSRISIGEDSGGANTAATLRRYPVGAAVAVYYDPNNPRNCVLERDVPQGMAKGCAAIVAMLGVIAASIYLFASSALHYLQAHIPNPDKAPVVVFATCFGLAVLVFFFGARAYSKQAMKWPKVRGTIVSSTVESHQQREDDRITTAYTPAVEFAYRVNGVDYRSRQIKLGIALGGAQAMAETIVARYPQGGAVDVHYDPADPTNAALENPSGYSWLLLAVALFCFAVAVYASGIVA